MFSLKRLWQLEILLKNHKIEKFLKNECNSYVTRNVTYDRLDYMYESNKPSTKPVTDSNSENDLEAAFVAPMWYSNMQWVSWKIKVDCENKK